MKSDPKIRGSKGDVLLDMRDVIIDGFSDEQWHPIIKGVDLTLRRGEVLGLIGESGAGKSTLGKAAMGYAQPGCAIKSGSIVFDGIDLLTATEAEKMDLWGSRIAYVAQSAAASFNPAHRLIDQTIEATVGHAVATDIEARKDAVELYGALSLPDPKGIGQRYPHQVSGGQLQRVMTAMAMSPRPDLIIFDEPTTRIKVLRYGEEVEDAETNTMLEFPREDYTKSLWSVRALEKPEDPSDDIVLDIKNIDAAYEKSVKVLKNVSIKVPRGRTVSIVGESGSGKSTTARVLTGLMPPLGGAITFNGQTLSPSIKERSKDQLRRIQMIYQMADTAMNPKQTVGEIIGRPLSFYHDMTSAEEERRVIDLLKMIELDETFIDRLPSELSGGQKQRICIARALAAEPEVIICDEVTSALDQIVQEGILTLLLKLQKELRITYLFITHDIAVVTAISDEIVVMYQGEVIEQGLKSRVLHPPHPDYTKLLLNSVPEMDPNWLDRFVDARD